MSQVGISQQPQAIYFQPLNGVQKSEVTHKFSWGTHATAWGVTAGLVSAFNPALAKSVSEETKNFFFKEISVENVLDNGNKETVSSTAARELAKKVAQYFTKDNLAKFVSTDAGFKIGEHSVNYGNIMVGAAALTGVVLAGALVSKLLSSNENKI